MYFCDYGCGNEAIITFKNGKKCCQEKYSKCPGLRKKYSNPGSKNPRFGKHWSEEWKKNHSEKLVGRKIKRTFIPIKLEEDKNILCDFCNKRLAKYKLNNGKNCCEEHQSKCPEIRVKIGKKIKGKMVGINHPFFGKTHTDEVKQLQSIRVKGNKYNLNTLNKINKKYPFFSEIENTKEINGSLIVKCKHCKKWFEPTRSQLYERIYAIKNKGTIHDTGNSYFYCSSECKLECVYYYRKKDPDILREYERYKQNVLKYTNRNIKFNFDKIENSSKKINGDNLELDHKFSIYSGFINNIDPKIIGHWKNLKYIKKVENRKKRESCSITIEEVLSYSQEV